MNPLFHVRILSVLTVLVAASLAAARATASDFIYHFDRVYSGPGAGNDSPWIQALFQDAAPGTVRLTLSSDGLTGTEFVSRVLFNLNPDPDAGSLSIVSVGGSGDVAQPWFTHVADGLPAGGGDRYDLRFSFAAANAGRFVAGRSLEYLITGAPGLAASDFAFLSAAEGGLGPFYAAAHIQAIGDADYSVWICPKQISPVPEPSGPALLGSLAGLGLLSRRRR